MSSCSIINISCEHTDDGKQTKKKGKMCELCNYRFFFFFSFIKNLIEDWELLNHLVSRYQVNSMHVINSIWLSIEETKRKSWIE
jgi:hypothetical protein